jgi:hypothetical protein
MTQLELPLSEKPPSIRLMVLEAMGDREWWRLEQLATYCKMRGKWVSDATISARLRELKAQGYPHETRPRGKGSSAVEYRLSQ